METNATFHPEGSDPAIQYGRTVRVPAHALDADLESVKRAGFDAAEIAVGQLNCIIGGRLSERVLELVLETCDRHTDLIYTVHSPAVLDLRNQDRPELHREILLSSVRFAQAIKARVLVVHYEARSEQPAIEAQFRASIEAAAELASQIGLILGVENIEVERTERVLEFIAGVNHRSVRMTYDFGHDYLAGDLFGYDHIASARACAPYVAHLHITDNHGHFNQARLGDFNLYKAIPYVDIVATGLGDMHLPLGLGTLPAQAVHDAVTSHGYRGLLVSEHQYDAFPTFDVDVRQNLQALASGTS
jgi:sugar phosphate isomerase/epimerase